MPEVLPHSVIKIVLDGTYLHGSATNFLTDLRIYIYVNLFIMENKTLIVYKFYNKTKYNNV